jgi:FG-GAP-like repeat
MAMRCVHTLLVLLAALCAGGIRAGAAEGDTNRNRGRLLAVTYCSQCHLAPSPQHLDRRTWHEELFPKMRYVAGIEPPPTNNYFADLDLLQQAKYFPSKPLIPPDAFHQIEDYFTNAAPEALTPSPDAGKPPMTLRLFKPESAKARRTPQMTSLLRFDPELGVIQAGDVSTQGIDVLDDHGNLINSLEVGNIPVSLFATPDAWWVAGIGHFFPREQPSGQIIRFKRTPAGLVREEILSHLPRTVDVAVADLNGDGREDFVVCEYGNYLGRLSWYEQKRSGSWEEHVLLPESGCLKCIIRDFNHDGRPDLAVLQAQAKETFHIFVNEGGGRFSDHVIFQRPPSWGHSGFDLADFDGDGEPDLLVTNGDNADFNLAPPKPYHGIRIYLNKGGLKFEEAAFLPLHGAYKAVARDFDQDGDLDIAAISFFPDYATTPQEGFVYFENVGGPGKFDFRASTLSAALAGHWLTMDVGDIDHDGDEDLILGSMTRMSGDVPDELKKRWEERGPSVLILRNQTRQAAPKP